MVELGPNNLQASLHCAESCYSTCGKRVIVTGLFQPTQRDDVTLSFREEVVRITIRERYP